MDNSLFWLTRLCARLRDDPFPPIPYVGPLGNYLRDKPFPALEILFVSSGALREVEAGTLKRDIGTHEVALLNQHFGVRSARCDGAESWCMLIDVSGDPLFAALARKPLFLTFRATRPDRLLAAFRNVAAWTPRMVPQVWHAMARGPDLSLSVPLATARSAPIHQKAALYELFAILMDEAEQGGSTARLSAPVRAVVEHILARYADPVITLSSLTRVANVCPSHLWRLFKQEIGMSPMRFLRDTRLRQGAALLERTPLRVNEIAGRVGFDDALYFSRTFTKVFRCSPQAFRKRGK